MMLRINLVEGNALKRRISAWVGRYNHIRDLLKTAGIEAIKLYGLKEITDHEFMCSCNTRSGVVILHFMFDPRFGEYNMAMTENESTVVYNYHNRVE
jgi:hypothetical protein